MEVTFWWPRGWLICRRVSLYCPLQGLGKTVQAIAFLVHLFERGWSGPFLIIVPSSTIGEFGVGVPSVGVPSVGVSTGSKKECYNVISFVVPV